MNFQTVTKDYLEWAAENEPYDFLVFYAYRLIKREFARVSKENGFYDWQLATWDIAKAFIDLEETTELFCRQRISRNQFIAGIHLYCDIVYQESEKAWLENWCQNLKLERPERCESLWLNFRDLEFLNNRFQAWVRDERYGFIELDIDNQIPQEDLSHVKAGFMGLDHVIKWGKYKIQQYTIQGLIDHDPSWLHWAATQTNRLNISPEMMTKILEAQANS